LLLNSEGYALLCFKEYLYGTPRIGKVPMSENRHIV